MDTLIIRRWGNTFTDIFIKATHSNTYIHYFSYHGDSVKLSVLSSLFLRAYRICSPCYLEKEIDLLFDGFSKLGYTKLFIQKAHLKARRSYFVPRSNARHFQKPSMVFPYVKELKSTAYSLNKLDIKTAISYPNTIGKSIIRNAPKNYEKIGVYSLPCKMCPLTYVGEFGRSLDKRLNIHKQAIIQGNASSVLFMHISENNHQIK